MTQPTSSCSEHELIAAFRRGEERAFEELFSRYRGRIGSYILGMVGDHGRVDDIAQEVFISALRRLRATEHPIAFKPWIYEIAKNACIDEFRRARRAPQVPLELDDGSDASTGIGPRLVSSRPTPDVAVESKQQLEDLCGAFGVLSDSHHRIIVLRELEGLSYSQIGERMGISRPKVESTLFRARRRLTREYEDLASGLRCRQLQTLIDEAPDRSARALGVRERRQLARHFAHCQPCRRHARKAGFDASILGIPTLAGKIAALLPIPWLRWPTLRHRPPAAQSAHSLASMPPLQAVARYTDPAWSGAAGALGRGAAAVAAVVIAGVGGGLVTGLAGHHSHGALVSAGQSAAGGGHHGGSSLGAGAGAGAGAAGGRASAASASTGVAGSSTLTSVPSRNAVGRSARGFVPGLSVAGASGSGLSTGPYGAGAGRYDQGSTASGPSSAGTSSGANGGGRQNPPAGAPGDSHAAPSGPGSSTPGLPLPRLPLPSLPLPLPSLPLPLPSLPLPKVGLPQLPQVPLPKVGLPQLPQVPLPKVGLPQSPQVKLPPLPQVRLPALGPISLSSH